VADSGRYRESEGPHGGVGGLLKLADQSVFGGVDAVRSASSASMALMCARIGTLAGESGRTRARLAYSSRLARSSSPTVSAVTS
jgi:hypothetical protein